MTSGYEGRRLALFRLVPSYQPTWRDFRSPKLLGRNLRDKRMERYFDGVSFWAHPELAAEQHAAFPRLGDFVAAMVILEGLPIRWEDSFSIGHVTVWGRPEILALAVIAVEPWDYPHRLSVAYANFVRGLD
jgi:hypothetical protein